MRVEKRRFWIAGISIGLAAATPLAAAVPEQYAVLSAKEQTYHAYYGLAPGMSGATPVAYFRVNTSVDGGSTLWRTDGTAAGTHAATSGDYSGQVSRVLVPSGGGAYFIAADSDGIRQVHWTDGSGAATSTRQLTHEPTDIREMVGLIDDRPVFVRRTADGESLLRIEDGQGTLSSIITFATRADRSAEWVLGPSAGLAMWMARESPGGYRVTHFGWNGEPSVSLPAPAPESVWNYPHAAGAGSRIFCLKAYTVAGARLHCTDGTVAGTIRPTPPSLGSDVWLPDFVEFTRIRDKLLFITHAQTGPYRPWVTDGTDAGTYALLDDGPWPLEACTEESAGELYFTGAEGSAIALWRTDGTRNGTIRLGFVPGRCGFRGVAREGGERAYIGVGTALYATDGTVAGTGAVAGAPALFTASSETGYRGIVQLGRWIVFAAPNGDSGSAFWRIERDPIFAHGFD